jgi:hypothetical protein
MDTGDVREEFDEDEHYIGEARGSQIHLFEWQLIQERIFLFSFEQQMKENLPDQYGWDLHYQIQNLIQQPNIITKSKLDGTCLLEEVLMKWLSIEIGTGGLQ